MATRKPTSFDARFPAERATAPDALEETSESAWQRFLALQEAPGADFERTQAQSGRLAFDPTRPMEPQADRDAASGTGPVTLDDVMVLARRNNRACPVPAQWAAFHRLLPTQALQGRVLVAPPPLQNAEWPATSPISKRLRLRDQIEWAARTGALQVAHDFLAALPEDQWHHLGQ
ncbi:MAG TPA: hypothetical protein VFE82_05695 [Ramlibacter sp.]|jgi:hypothetical protein|uniref:hypothetical protein n=1 Tax=Ramlibacter sp. TaxID=1917967 RepID=UPI002D67EC64|nr:hypothetical protein [Ramlibacter sp.]HZY17955.1 hypothetical protein [Ramlibacter sp.]